MTLSQPAAPELRQPEARDAALESLLERIEHDAERHVTSGPVPEAQLAQLEAAVGHRLPAPFRSFLARLGAGLYYERHEIFGPLRTMIHDIELVPPLLRVCRGLPAGVIPVHRAGDVVHFMDLRSDSTPTPVFPLLSGQSHSDFTSFLREVVVPPCEAAADPS